MTIGGFMECLLDETVSMLITQVIVPDGWAGIAILSWWGRCLSVAWSNSLIFLLIVCMGSTTASATAAMTTTQFRHHPHGVRGWLPWICDYCQSAIELLLPDFEMIFFCVSQEHSCSALRLEAAPPPPSSLLCSLRVLHQHHSFQRPRHTPTSSKQRRSSNAVAATATPLIVVNCCYRAWTASTTTSAQQAGQIVVDAARFRGRFSWPTRPLTPSKAAQPPEPHLPLWRSEAMPDHTHTPCK